MQMDLSGNRQGQDGRLVAHAKGAVALHREPGKGGILSSYTSMIRIQKGVFSGLSMRNRGILETEADESRSDLDRGSERLYAAEKPHSY